VAGAGQDEDPRGGTALDRYRTVSEVVAGRQFQQVLAEADENAPAAIGVPMLRRMVTWWLRTERMPVRGMPTTVKPSITTSSQP
jgi:hypothetical protein